MSRQALAWLAAAPPLFLGAVTILLRIADWLSKGDSLVNLLKHLPDRAALLGHPLAGLALMVVGFVILYLATQNRESPTKIYDYRERLLPAPDYRWVVIVAVITVSAAVIVTVPVWFYFREQSPAVPSERRTATSVQFQRPEVQRGIPFAINSGIGLNVHLINKGPDTAQSLLWGVEHRFTELPPTKDTEEGIWNAFMARILSEHLVDTEHDLGAGDYRWVTVETSRLSAADISYLQSGRYHLFVTGLALYRDTQGELQSELCVYLQPPGNPVVWRRCEAHNSVGRPSVVRRSSR